MGQEVSKDDFDKKIVGSKGAVMVDFYAPWCSPCQMMTPVLDEVAKAVGKNAKIYKVNIDEEHELANQYQVMSIPTIFIFKDGKISKQFNGVVSKEELVDGLK